MMERLVKSLNGQWKLVSEVLKKTPQNTTPPTTSAPSGDINEQRESNHKQLSTLFNTMNDHAVSGRNDQAKAVKGQIKDFALKAPKGSIDIGRLGDMREQHVPLKEVGRGYGGTTLNHRPLNHVDMADIINHHIGDAKGLKDIYENHGGEKTIKTLMRTMGGNGVPSEYSTLHFSKPGVHEDLLDLVNPRKNCNDRKLKRHLGVMGKAPFSSTPVDPELHKKAVDTWNVIMHHSGEGDEWENKVAVKAHEEAVVERGIERFKRHNRYDVSKSIDDTLRKSPEETPPSITPTPPEVIELMSALENFEPLKKKSEDDLTAPKSIAAEVGKTHTVEVHPDLDHLYRAKGLIKDSGKDAMHISAFKKNDSFNHITNKLPKDSKGFVTPEAIDKHIESLPKHKVDIRVLDSFNRPQEQKHRKDATEYTLSMNMHPNTKAKMGVDQLKQWDRIKGMQHSWEPKDEAGSFTGSFDSLKNKDQIGWVRIDPHKNYGAQIGKVADTVDGGSVWHDGKDNYTIKHPKGNVTAWHDKSADHVSNSWSKKDHDEEVEQGLHPKSTTGYGFSDEDLNDPKIMAHLNQAEDIIKNHKTGEKEHPHWHLDEIQSDFQNPSKLKNKLASGNDPVALARTHPDWDKTSDELQAAALADDNHPLMKEWQEIDDGTHWSVRDAVDNRDDNIHEIVAPYAQRIMQDKYPELNTPAGEDPVDMTAEQESEYDNIISEEKENASSDPDHPLYDQVNDEYENFEADPDNTAKAEVLDDATYKHLKNKDPKYFESHEEGADPKKMLERLSLGHDDPQHMLHSAVNALARKLNIKSTSMDMPEDQAKKSVLHTKGKPLPVHQIDTYNKRPKKLGMQRVDKESLLGENSKDEAKDIQYARLHKRLKQLYTQLEKLKKVT